MNLNISEQFLILAMHPEKPRYLVSGPSIHAGLIGAMLIDLSIEEKILIENGRLKCKSSTSKLSEAHQRMLTFIHDSSKERSVKLWIRKMSGRTGTYRKLMLEILQHKGIIRLEKKRFLFIPYLKAYLIKKNDRIKLINAIRDTLIYTKKTDLEMASLLGLIQACQMIRILSKESSERKHFKIKLDQIMKSDEIASGVNIVVREMQAAILASLVVTTVAASH